MSVHCNRCNINWMRCYYLRWLFDCWWFREFYSILFTCLPVSPCGDYLPTRYGSHEIRWLSACRIWVFWSCRIDVDNPYVLVVEIEICNKIRCRSMQKNKFEMKVFWGGLVWSFICVASYSFASDLGVNFKFGLAVALVLIVSVSYAATAAATLPRFLFF